MGVPRTVLMGRRFWQQSERDLEAARVLLQPGTYYAAASFAHQAAEKALKAAHWHLRAEEPPWRHDLVALVGPVGERGGGIPANVADAVRLLNPMSEIARYPSGNVNQPIPAELIAEADARAAVAAAEEVTRWVQALLQRLPAPRS